MRAFSIHIAVVLGLSVSGLIHESPVRGQPANPGDLPVGALKRIGSPKFSHTGRIQALAYSPDGKLLAAGGGRDVIRIWDVATGKQVMKIDEYWVRTLAFTPDGNHLVSGGGFKRVNVWDVRVGKKVTSLEMYHSPGVRCSHYE